MKRVYTGWAVARSRFGLRSFSCSCDSSASPRAGSRSWAAWSGMQSTSSLGLSRRGAQRLYISPHHRHFKEGM